MRRDSCPFTHTHTKRTSHLWSANSISISEIITARLSVVLKEIKRYHRNGVSMAYLASIWMGCTGLNTTTK